MPSSRSAPNRRCAVPGTPIMPAPSRLTSAMRSIVVMPLTSGSGSERSWISVPGLSAANVFLIQIGMRFCTAGAIVAGWITLAPKYASSIASLYESVAITCASGHEPRIGAQHAVDVRPDDDLAGIEQRAEDRGGVVAAVAAERGLQPVRVGGDEARDDERADEVGGDEFAQLRARLLPAHARAHRPPLDQQRPARVEPLHVARRRGDAAGARTAASTRARRSPRSGRASWSRRCGPGARSAGCRRCRAGRPRARRRTRRRARPRAVRPRCRRGAGAVPAGGRRASGEPCSASVTSDSSASVTPRQADSTTALRGAGSASMIRATRSMHAASATLDPPNL